LSTSIADEVYCVIVPLAKKRLGFFHQLLAQISDAGDWTACNGTVPEDVFVHLQDILQSDIATAQAPVCREH
jgi:hypothetical protein